MAGAKKIDPFDVEALEKSLNDSATRVSTIWVSFLIFSLYLLIAATTVTHRQLFLAEPVKLPVLNIDLPLWGFFWLAPILFVVFHAYVLIQLILLARTAAAYDAAVAKLIEEDNLSPKANASLRQRLANTLFAQILAGSPREREGWFGSLLKAMAWITLVIAPILILLTFQFMFLPYHSHLATWTHRLLILLELVVAFKLWPLVLNPGHDFQWRSGDMDFRVTRLFRSREDRLRGRQFLRRLALPIATIALYIFLPLSLATYPGELHVNLFTGQALDGVQCTRWIQRKFGFADMRYDRLALERVDVVDDEKFEKIQQATLKAGERPYQGERTRILRDRDLNCGDFSDYADLRRMDLSGAYLRNADFRFSKLDGVSCTKCRLQDASLIDAQLQGVFLDEAELQGASLDGARLQGASLKKAQLRHASLYKAQLQGASLDQAQLQEAFLAGAQLQGASLAGAQLQGASLNSAGLQGVSLNAAELQGASLESAELQGSSLDHTKLHGATFFRAQLQGASFVDAELQGASFLEAELQGATLHGNLDDAILSLSWIWRARVGVCDKTRIINPRNDGFIGLKTINGETEPARATPAQIEEFIKHSVAGIQSEERKERTSKILRDRLTVDPAKDDTTALQEVWRNCENESRKISEEEFDDRLVAVLRATVCGAWSDGAAIGNGVTRNWVSKYEDEFSVKLASALLGEDGKPCAPSRNYDEETIRRLRLAGRLAPE